jgi:SAM-dependent methyltransferase
MSDTLRNLLQHPLTKGLDLDDPSTTELRSQIILGKPLLKKIYMEWYGLLFEHIPEHHGTILELGAGAGFSTDFFPQVIRSDILLVNNIDIVCDGHQLPFPSGALDAILMVNVLHHIHNPVDFFQNADRCLKRGGVIAMIEPWNTRWSSFVYSHLHHEPFYPDKEEWGFDSGGPLSGANGAIPWIIFSRERKTFERTFPQLSIDLIQPMMPVVYLFSGGVSLKSLMPGFSYATWRWLERKIQAKTGMFALVVIKKSTLVSRTSA